MELSALAMLVAFLCASVGWRHLAARRRRRTARVQCGPDRQWPLTALNVAALAPPIQQLRRNYASAIHSRPRHSAYRSALMADVRWRISRTSYFRKACRERAESAGHDSQATG